MTPTGVLREEHEGIKQMLSVLDEMCNRLESRGNVPSDHFDKVVDFLKTFVDKCHHGKEEDLLFKAMEEAGIPRNGGPVAVMLMEHETGRGFVRALAAGVEKYKKGDNSAAQEISDNGHNYVELLWAHIDKENNILYNIADMHVPKPVQDQLLKAFEKIETERIGPGKHEEYHRLIGQLSNVYGVSPEKEKESGGCGPCCHHH